jgi:uracil-DNA glycosylase
LKNDLNITKTNGDLANWAQQGVLLLNTALTYAPNHPELMKLWEPFIIDVIKWIDEQNWNVVFILWGKHAQKFIPYIHNNQEHIILSGHPSFASVHKQFFNTKPFSKTNDLLLKLKQTPIKW